MECKQLSEMATLWMEKFPLLPSSLEFVFYDVSFLCFIPFFKKKLTQACYALGHQFSPARAGNFSINVGRKGRVLLA